MRRVPQSYPAIQDAPSLLLVPRSSDELFRLGLLIVGLARHPFTIQVTQQHRTLRELRMSDLSRSISRLIPTINHKRRHVHLRYFRALLHPGRKGPATAPRYLRASDADTVALMKMRGETVRARYIATASEIALDADLPSVLSSAPTHEWTPEESLEEIHVLVVLTAYSLSLNDPGPKIPLFRSRAPPRPQLCYGSDMDRRFHLYHWWPEDNCMRVLFEYSPDDADGVRRLPVFNQIQLTHRHCERPLHWPFKNHGGRIARWWRTLKQHEWTLSQPPYSSPRLCELAQDVVFHLLLAGPPQFLDPVACVVDASLLLDNTVVHENVLCFVKFLFDDDDRSLPKQWAQTVNPRMLAMLDQVAEMGDPTRPRLLVIATTLAGQLRLEAAQLPTTFSTIVVVARDTSLGSPVHEPMRYLGNAEDEDVCDGGIGRSANGRLDHMLEYDVFSSM